MTVDPIAAFGAALEKALASEAFDATRACLATVDGEGHPSARFVLVKEHGPDGFVFYTNYRSRKAADLDATARAALAFHWASTGVQVRIEGTVSRASAERSDAYFETRPRGSQIGAWASPQSSPLASHDELLAAVAKTTTRFEGQEIPRPPHWGGYVLLPSLIEFWTNGDDRLHERLAYRRDGERWEVTRLAP